jgi:23S rRNA pseudouridine1911/1915/1917 synthase
LENYNIEADESWSDKRIDKALSDYFADYSRSFIKKLFDDKLIKVNDKAIKPSSKVTAGDRIDISVPEPVSVNIEPENIPLDIVYEDDDFIIVNKPKGMVVHPAPGHYSGTLVNGLMYHFEDNLSTINGEFRPGIVHRIDMDTTGLLVVCKNDKAHKSISEQLSVHSITRKYYAIVYNHFSQEEGTVAAPIGRHPVDRKKMAVNYKNGREAVTHYKVLQNLKNNFAFIECQLETGRTHQIRVHMSSINHPLLGDEVYGPKNKNYNLTGQTLHAGVLGFVHPSTGEYVEFSSELPEYFKKLLEKLN